MARVEKTALSNDESEGSAPESDLLGLVAKLVCSYLGHNHVPQADVPSLIRTLHATLHNLSGFGAVEQAPEPAVPIKKSISDEYIVCLEDGKKLRTLKRYLRTHYKLSPDEYRAKWGLPRDYPMVAPAYARVRSAFAKKIGLGRIPGGAKGRSRKAA